MLSECISLSLNSMQLLCTGGETSFIIITNEADSKTHPRPTEATGCQLLFIDLMQVRL